MKSEANIKMEQSLLTAIIHMASESLSPDDFDVLLDKLNILAKTRELGEPAVFDEEESK